MTKCGRSFLRFESLLMIESLSVGIADAKTSASFLFLDMVSFKTIGASRQLAYKLTSFLH
jgi:hypothetical protein